MQLIIDNLSKTYPNGTIALDDLSIIIDKGMFGLLGPNGAGKSSLMRSIATLQRVDSGSIQFNDIDVLQDPMSLRKTLGYLPQSFGVYPKISAVRLLDYLATLKGIASKSDRKKLIEEVLHLTNLTDARNKAVSGYSGGMKQRFGIAQLLLNKPKLIIVDEPTAGLDPAERQRFLNLLRGIGQENIVIFSTHIVDDVKELCTGLAIMNHGKILKQNTPNHCIAELEGKIWTVVANERELGSLKAMFQVISSNYNADGTLTIRIYAEVTPGQQFSSATPNLEDVYFITLASVTSSVQL